MPKTITKKVVIKNKMGLHARPASKFVQIALQYESEVTVTKDGLEVNGKSIMGVLMLAAEMGSEVTVRAKGKDAKEVVDALALLLEGELDGE
jgi:phosphocarrier protein HPr